jgi:hypothetical protein
MYNVIFFFNHEHFQSMVGAMLLAQIFDLILQDLDPSPKSTHRRAVSQQTINYYFGFFFCVFSNAFLDAMIIAHRRAKKKRTNLL